MMPAIYFQDRFAPLVESGQKRQTIRKLRTRPINIGDKLILRDKPRQPGGRVLREAVCRAVYSVSLSQDTMRIRSWPFRAITNLNEFAKADGFESWSEMRDWFERQYGLPFYGVLIQW